MNVQNKMRGFSNTHGKGKRVKKPLLPNRVGKRSRQLSRQWVYFDQKIMDVLKSKPLTKFASVSHLS